MYNDEAPSTPDNYKNLSAPDLRKLCAFKDGTIDILNNAVIHLHAQLETARTERNRYQSLFNDLRHDRNPA